MRRYFSFAAISLFAAQTANAQTAPVEAAPPIDTLYFVVRDGIVMTTQGHTMVIDYNEDGTFIGELRGSAFEGTYRLDGARLCAMSSLATSETCIAYPEGMTSGDTFDAVSPALGGVRIHIRTPEENRAAAAAAQAEN
ncbi:hypothetical protein D1224_04720 [Henriciella barbarensis]|uniref:Secreted protein n=1 Tax=Henriciella barbarensis TaxID=86342 RepID=A0A399R1C6_9PROT|nr:hypothetical protein [Henriciella barbarensis]RIJ23572.1 hypothetical protein D1224_04720 [Henriciella barbarensis]